VLHSVQEDKVMQDLQLATVDRAQLMVQMPLAREYPVAQVPQYSGLRQVTQLVSEQTGSQALKEDDILYPLEQV